MRALVTGSAGFVGANLVRHLRDRGHEPIAVLRPGSSAWRLDGLEDLTRVELDLAAVGSVADAIGELKPGWIFHLAAHGAYSWQQDLRQMVAVNVECTEALLAAGRRAGAQTLVYAGSSSEYGYKDHAPREDERLEPNSHYAVTKAAGTHLCRLAAANHGQRAVTVRLSSVYGLWEEPGRLLPTLVAEALQGRWPPLVAPETARDFVWAGDVCDALLKAASRPLWDPGAVFNVGSGRQTTIGELVSIAREVFAVTAEPEWGSMDQRPWDTSIWVSDPSAAASVLDWRAVTSLREGMSAFAAWLKETSWCGRYRDVADRLALERETPSG